ncbi:hypothetical protein O0I10_013231 [Lichtheimia ornata]|uniref:Uncharacterized protein n=1 Tax=Lichtheimia ornata TaxID=688661 RepID=A0AAD7URD8_9FUNG|nr:uncharacterized protein O0I10_013231 [Lichtheimia ornata]KAJ8651284.1 hypothetical protein O0I10_013231 [Lichtheimia ornata]
MANPIELEDEDQHLNLAVVVKDTVSMVLEISYLQVVSLSVDLQSKCFYRCHGGSHSSSTCMDTFDVLLASQYPRVCYFIKTGFICCSA